MSESQEIVELQVVGKILRVLMNAGAVSLLSFQASTKL